MNKQLLVGLLVLSATLLNFMPANHQAQDLRLKLKKGDVFKMENTTDQFIEQEIMGQTQEQHQVMKYTLSYEVTDVVNKIYTLKITYLAVSAMMDTPMGKMEYDSENHDGGDISPMLKGFAALPGKHFEIKVNEMGQTIEVNGTDEMLDQLVKEFDLPDENTREQVRGSLKRQFGDKALKSNMESAMALYPEKPVNPGDNWKTSVTTEVMTSMVVNNQYTLDAIEGNTANLSVQSTIKSKPNGEGLEMGGMKLFYEMNGEQAGKN